MIRPSTGTAATPPIALQIPTPPADLDRRTPVHLRLLPGERLHRFYPKGRDPIYFDRGLGGRLNAPDGSYGVLYTARTAAGALAETFMRTPGRLSIDPALMAVKAYAQLEVLAPLIVIDFDGPGLPILGATAEVVHGPPPYALPQCWSKALKTHRLHPDGIAYTARHDPDEECFALFDGAPVRVALEIEELDDTWFWGLADHYRIGRPTL